MKIGWFLNGLKGLSVGLLAHFFKSSRFWGRQKRFLERLEVPPSAVSGVLALDFREGKSGRETRWQQAIIRDVGNQQPWQSPLQLLAI